MRYTPAPMNDTAPTIERAYRVRLHPTPGQAHTLARLFGARRFVWNWALARKDAAWRADGTKLTGIDLSRELTLLRQAPDTAWLGTLPREPFNQTLRDFDRGWSNFFAGRAKRPRRKRFGTVNSARFTLDQRREGLVRWHTDADEDLRTGSVQLDGVGRVKFRVTEPMAGRLRSVTVSRDSAGRWFATFTADGVPAQQSTAAHRAALGIDVGLRETAVLSNGERIVAAKSLTRHQARLRRYQRRYTRQRDAAARRQGLDPDRPFPKGTRIAVSNRMRATTRRIGALHARIADTRRDHLHQTSAAAIATATVIAIEDLAVKAMGRSMGRRAFRRSIADAGLGELRRQLTYKAQWRNRTLVVVDRFFPSSKTCGVCGAINAALALKERRWTCAGCGAEHDRDLNAAQNIEREGLRLLADMTGPDGRTPRSGGTHARGVAACAAGSASPVGQPTTTNRELTYRAAKPRTRRTPREDPGRRREG